MEQTTAKEEEEGGEEISGSEQDFQARGEDGEDAMERGSEDRQSGGGERAGGRQDIDVVR